MEPDSSGPNLGGLETILLLRFQSISSDHGNLKVEEAELLTLTQRVQRNKDSMLPLYPQTLQ
jgi:hypothetical protein